MALAIAGGYEAQQRFNDDRYQGGDRVLDYIASEAPAGQHIGLIGAWEDTGVPPVLPAFGPRFDNRVEYVGKPFKELLYPYDPRFVLRGEGGLDLRSLFPEGAQPADRNRRRRREEFVARLTDERYDYLMVGRGREAGFRSGDELEWALGAGYARVTTSDRFVLLRAPA